MGRSPSITVGDAREGVRVEHVKSRGLVRLVRWSARSAQDDAVGMEVDDFCARLGITTDVLGVSSRYLLVAGSRRPGARPLVALFSTDVDARAEFVRVRRSQPGPGAWGQVTELTNSGDVRPICWFGLDATDRPSPAPERRRRVFSRREK